MEDVSVFAQASEGSHEVSREANAVSHNDEEDESHTLSITTTAQQPASGADGSTASPTSPGPFFVVKTVARSSDAQRSSSNTGATEEGRTVGDGAPVRSHAVRPQLPPPPPPPTVSAEPPDQPEAGPLAGATASESVAAPSTTTVDLHAGTGSSVRDEAKMAQSGPLRDKPLVPDNVVKGRSGAAAPLPLSAIPKSQLRVMPTGHSDSDTDEDGDSESESTGTGSPQRKRAEAEEDEEERMFVDEFGFVIDEDEREKDEQFVRGIDGKQVARREIKWANMAADWDRTNYKMHAKLKERCRKGIPSRLRGVAWQLLTSSRKQMMSPENDGVYVALRDKKLRDKEVDEVLGRDLTRTFPNHVLFKDEGGVGQTFLRNVLHAYAGCDPEVGYTQGMAFIVGTLSTQMAEEESFWALHELMYNERYKMRELFKPGFPLLHQFFYQLKRLIAKLLPKLSKRFEELEIEPSFYASQWFMTLFVYHFPFRAVLRIWDIFFSEGWKIIFRTGIALMKWEQKRLLAMTFDELLPTLKTLAEGKDTKELVRRAHRVKFKTADLNRYGDEYWASKGTTLDG